jgi:hypothetical protein
MVACWLDASVLRWASVRWLAETAAARSSFPSSIAARSF